MKSADIKIGEKYVVEYGYCGKVLETRLELQGWSGSVRKEGVKVLIQGGQRDGQEKIVPSRDIYELWSVREQREEERRLHQKAAAHDREKSEALTRQLKKALRGIGIEVRDSKVSYGYKDGERSHYGAIGLDDSEMQRLITLLGAPEVAEQANKPQAETPNPLADLLA